MVGYARPVQQSLNVINAEKQGVLILKIRDVPLVLRRQRKGSVTRKKDVSGLRESALWMHMSNENVTKKARGPCNITALQYAVIILLAIFYY